MRAHCALPCGAAVTPSYSISHISSGCVHGPGAQPVAKSVRRDVWYLLVRARFWLRKVRKKEKREKREKSKSQKVEKQWFLQSSRFLPFVFRKKNRKIRNVRKVKK